MDLLNALLALASATESVNSGESKMSKRPRKCPTCGKTFNFIDWANHQGAHLSEAEKRLVQEEMQAQAALLPKPKPLTDEDWERLQRGE